MKKHILLFASTFVVGALVAFAARTALHEPYQAPTDKSAPAAESHHAHARAESEKAPAAAQKTVNTVCAICGMTVDPKIKPAEYKGKLVGFGCGACPKVFAKNPERYGEAALENRVLAE